MCEISYFRKSDTNFDRIERLEKHFGFRFNVLSWICENCLLNLLCKTSLCLAPYSSMSSLLAKGLGCFRDTGRRAILPLEGKSVLLKGQYRRRRYAIQKCALAAQKRGYRVFAVQHQGWCASTKYAYRTFGKYGRSNKCRNGKGGPWANDVYVLKGITLKPFLRVIQ